MLETEDLRSEAFKAQLDRFKIYSVERGNHWKAQLDDASFVLHTSLWVPQQHVKSAEEYSSGPPYKLEKDTAALFPEWYFQLVRNFGKKSVFHRFYCAKSRLDFISFMHGPEIDRLQIASAMDWEFSTAVKAGFGPSLEELYEDEILSRETVETKVVSQLADMSSWLVIAARENELKSRVRFGHASYLAIFLMAYDYSERLIWRIIVGLMIEVDHTREQYRVIDEKIQEFEKDPAPLLSKIRDFILYLIEKGLFVKDLFPEVLEKQARMRELELTFNKRRQPKADKENGNLKSNGIDTKKFPALPGTLGLNDSKPEEIRVKTEDPAPLGLLQKGGKIDDFRVLQQFLKDQRGSSSTNETSFSSIVQSEGQVIGLGSDATMLQAQANGTFGQNTMFSLLESLKPNAWNAESNKCLYQEQHSGSKKRPRTGSISELVDQSSDVESTQGKELGRVRKRGRKKLKVDKSEDPLAGLSKKEKKKQEKALLKSKGEKKKSSSAPKPPKKKKTTPPKVTKKSVHAESKKTSKESKIAKQTETSSEKKIELRKIDLNDPVVPATKSISFSGPNPESGLRDPPIQNPTYTKNPTFTQNPSPPQRIGSPRNMAAPYRSLSFRPNTLPNQDTVYSNNRYPRENSYPNQAAAKFHTRYIMNNDQNSFSTQPAHTWLNRSSMNFPQQPSHGLARSSSPPWAAHSMRVQLRDYRRPTGKERFLPSSWHS